jgi:hypothetical protein
VYIMALGFGGFLGAGSRTDEEIERRAEAERKRDAKRKQDSIEFNKKSKSKLQGALGKGLGGAVGDVLSFGSRGKGGIAGSLGLGGGGLFGTPKRKKTPTKEEFMKKFKDFKQYKKTTAVEPMPMNPINPMNPMPMNRPIMKINRPPTISAMFKGKTDP